MPNALQHVCPVDSALSPGIPRFVSARRARKLRKRGVPVFQCATGVSRYMWWEPVEEVENRRARRGARCYQMHCYAVAGRVGRKHWLATRLVVARVRLLTGMTDAEAHHYVHHWYTLRITPPPAASWARKTPNITAWLPRLPSHKCVAGWIPEGILQREDETDEQFVARRLALLKL